jgi:hypothetical protein
LKVERHDRASREKKAIWAFTPMAERNLLPALPPKGKLPFFPEVVGGAVTRARRRSTATGRQRKTRDARAYFFFFAVFFAVFFLAGFFVVFFFAAFFFAGMSLLLDLIIHT